LRFLARVEINRFLVTANFNWLILYKALIFNLSKFGGYEITFSVSLRRDLMPNLLSGSYCG